MKRELAVDMQFCESRRDDTCICDQRSNDRMSNHAELCQYDGIAMNNSCSTCCYAELECTVKPGECGWC
jgi:hypothetical protein